MLALHSRARSRRRDVRRDVCNGSLSLSYCCGGRVHGQPFGWTLQRYLFGEHRLRAFKLHGTVPCQSPRAAALALQLLRRRGTPLQRSTSCQLQLLRRTRLALLTMMTVRDRDGASESGRMGAYDEPACIPLYLLRRRVLCRPAAAAAALPTINTRAAASVLPTVLGLWRTGYAVSYAYGGAVAACAALTLPALTGIARWHALALIFYGVRLNLFLLWRELSFERFRKLRERIEDRAVSRGSRLARRGPPAPRARLPSPAPCTSRSRYRSSRRSRNSSIHRFRTDL